MSSFSSKSMAPILTCFAILVLSMVISALIGPTGLILPSIDLDPQRLVILLQIRIPRVLAAAAVGAGLACAGCLMQALFRNSLADPYLLGTSSGGALGAAIAMTLGIHSLLMPMAFVGCLSASLIVTGIARQGGRIKVESLILAGIAVSIFFSAVLSFILFTSGENLQQILFWLMGGLWTVSWDDVMTAAILIPVFLSLVLFGRELNVYSLGEEQAKSLGQDVDLLKKLVILSSSLLTAVSVSIAGTIGFVGLLTPHIMRLLAGPDHRRLIILSIEGGAILMIWSDTIARTLGGEMPVGIITAFLGAPFFIYLIRRDRL